MKQVDDIARLTIECFVFECIQLEIHDDNNTLWVCFENDWVSLADIARWKAQRANNKKVNIELFKADGAPVDGESVFRDCKYMAHTTGSMYTAVIFEYDEYANPGIPADITYVAL